MIVTIQELEGLPRHDVELIVAAEKMRWEDIDIQKAITAKARQLLKKIENRKFHEDEASLDEMAFGPC